MNRVCFDSSFLLALAEPNLPIAAEGISCPANVAQVRFRELRKRLDASRAVIVIPTPVLAELLVQRDPDRPSPIGPLQRSPRFELAGMGPAAASEVADIFRRNYPRRRGLQVLTRSKFKYDMIIVAIAKVSRCDTLFTTDGGLRALALREGIAVMGFDDLPDPKAFTPELPLEGQHASQAAPPPGT